MLDKLITSDDARQDYGVVVDAQSLMLDVAATMKPRDGAGRVR